MHTKIFTLALSLLVLHPAYCQLKLVSASLQNWSGGIAGHRGTYYYFEFTAGKASNITLDTLWLEGNVYAPLTGNNGDIHVKVNRGKKTTLYSINIKTYNFDKPLYAPEDKSTSTESKQIKKAYKGVALLSYNDGINTRSLLIKKFTSELPAINYP